jgi:peptide/nickel transport system ATP-binding protein
MLTIDQLSISYRVDGAWHTALRAVSLEVTAGQIVGIVGESGSGKSTLARAVMRYLPPNARTDGGRVLLFGEDITRKTPAQMRAYWGKRIAIVPQNPAAALNPALTIGDQLAEHARIHRVADGAAVRGSVIAALEQVGLDGALYGRYPHQLSGGQQQRAVIAMALLPAPQLLILDEPTTNLDVTSEATVLDLLRDLMRSQPNTAALYITHNLGVVAQLCQRMLVLYGGEVVTGGDVRSLFARPIHPYLNGLLSSAPQDGQTKYTAALQPIGGAPPSLTLRPSACVYAPRCPLAVEVCHHTKPPLEQLSDPTIGEVMRCHRWGEIAAGLQIPYEVLPLQVDPQTGRAQERENLLRVTDAAKHYRAPRRLREVLLARPRKWVRAVDGVNLAIQRGNTLGLVGESGSGKSTLARMIVGLAPRTDGDISLHDIVLPRGLRGRARATLAQMQMVFQNPQNALNPYHTVGQILARPLRTLRGAQGADVDAAVADLLRAVNLPPEYAARYPDELSGGEKQRVTIARAFASQPSLVICDEAVSALDVSVQAAIINLLARLQQDRAAAYLFISHDLAVVAYLADYVAVMYRGVLMEVGYAADVLAPPTHPYTEVLYAARPSLTPPTSAQPRTRLRDDIPPTPAISEGPLVGCRFADRCPRKIGPLCDTTTPPWQDVGNEHHIRCHIPLADLAAAQMVQVTQEGVR